MFVCMYIVQYTFYYFKGYVAKHTFTHNNKITLSSKLHVVSGFSLNAFIGFLPNSLPLANLWLQLIY